MKIKLAICLLATALCGCGGSRFHQQFGPVSLIPASSPKTSIDVARLREKQGAFERATVGYQALMKQEPGNPDPIHRLGVVAIHQGNHEEADRLFSQALQLAPPDAELLTDIGYLRYLQNRNKEAEDSLREALQKSRHNQRALNNLGMVLASQGREREALVAFSQATGPAEAHTSMGFILAQNGEIEKAKFHLGKALEHNPEHRRAAQGLVHIAQEYGVDVPGSRSPATDSHPSPGSGPTEERVAHAIHTNPVSKPVSQTAPDPFSMPPSRKAESYTEELLARLANGSGTTAGIADLFRQQAIPETNHTSQPQDGVTDTLNEKLFSIAAGERTPFSHSTNQSPIIEKAPELVARTPGAEIQKLPDLTLRHPVTAIRSGSTTAPENQAPATMSVRLGGSPTEVPMAFISFDHTRVAAATDGAETPTRFATGPQQVQRVVNEEPAVVSTVYEASGGSTAPALLEDGGSAAAPIAKPALDPIAPVGLSTPVITSDALPEHLPVSRKIIYKLLTALEYGDSSDQMQAIRDVLVLQPDSDDINAQLDRLASTSTGEVQYAARIAAAAR